MDCRFSRPFSVPSLAFLLLAALAPPGRAVAATPVGLPPLIVIGFVGGFVANNNPIHYEVQLAERLRSDYSPGVEVRMFANHRGEQARQEVLRLLDTDSDGTLSREEKSRARIAIYGHSWGASEAVTLARALERDGIPVLLTVQVDSVQKAGEDDATIPGNVLQAVNFYQSEGWLHGRPQIHAADSSRTEIVGNFHFAYKDKPVSCEGYSWFARTFMKPHIEIESDPAVWQQVESLIRAKLEPSRAK
jgi:hypothetical protein